MSVFTRGVSFADEFSNREHVLLQRVKVKAEEISLLVEDYKLIENFERTLQSGFNFAPYPVAVKKRGHTIGELAHWEFIPFWYENRKELEEARKKYTTLNAKGETLLTSRIYKEAARERRCLVLSSGFYEWRHYKDVAYPYHSLPQPCGNF